MRTTDVGCLAVIRYSNSEVQALSLRSIVLVKERSSFMKVEFA
jgi:hypothetical protein